MSGGFGFHEVAFLHQPSRTLVLTDLIDNFEPEKLSIVARPLVRLAGTMAPNGKAPIYLRFVINRNRPAAKLAAQRLVDWAPQQVIFAHGRWFDSDASAKLRHAMGPVFAVVQTRRLDGGSRRGDMFHERRRGSN